MVFFSQAKSEDFEQKNLWQTEKVPHFHVYTEKHAWYGYGSKWLLGPGFCLRDFAPKLQQWPQNSAQKNN